MYITTSAALKAAVVGSDGQVGTLSDLFFDDQSWSIRYLIADTGNWLSVNKVLLAPDAISDSAWNHQQIRLNLSGEKIKSSPPVDSEKPVSRRLLETLHGHYGWPAYAGSTVPVPPDTHKEIADQIVANDDFDPNLRSVNEITGYHVEGSNGDIGHIEDFILDDSDWQLRYLVVDTKNWWPGRKVVIDPKWTEEIDWHQRKFHLSMTKEQIKDSPEFDPGTPINREYEEQLYDFYGRPKYWKSMYFGEQQ